MLTRLCELDLVPPELCEVVVVVLEAEPESEGLTSSDSTFVEFVSSDMMGLHYGTNKAKSGIQWCRPTVCKTKQ